MLMKNRHRMLACMSADDSFRSFPAYRGGLGGRIRRLAAVPLGIRPKSRPPNTQRVRWIDFHLITRWRGRFAPRHRPRPGSFLAGASRRPSTRWSGHRSAAPPRARSASLRFARCARGAAQLAAVREPHIPAIAVLRRVAER